MSEILKSLEASRHNLETLLADLRRETGREYDNLNAELKRVRQIAQHEIETLQQTNQRSVELVEKMDKFSDHHAICAATGPLSFRGRCTCGLDELRAEIKKVKGQ